MPTTSIKLPDLNRRRKKRASLSLVYAVGGLCLLCVLLFNLNFMHRVLPPDTTAPSEQTNLPQRQLHPMEHFLKKKHGPAGTWKVVDWSNPFSPEEEKKFSCVMTPFKALDAAEESEMCVHTFPEVLTDFIKEKKRWYDCAILVSWWKYNGMEDDSSLFLDIGANIGSCVMEMLMSTKANIVAFEPHPMNVFNIKKTVSKLGKEYQDRLLLFPIGLGNIQGSTTIYSAHDNMGNSQLRNADDVAGNSSKLVRDWQAQEFRDQLQFTVFTERLDAILDSKKVDKIRLVKMDCQGFECNAADGMKSIADKIHYMKFEYDPRYLAAQGCTDLVARVKALGFNVYLTYGGITLHEELQANPTHGADFEMVASIFKLETTK